jgi:hypothetical protein
MSTAVTMERDSGASPGFRARMAGCFWLMTALTGTIALLAGDRTVAIAANSAATACYVAATLLVYELLKPVSPRLSLIAALASLLGCANGLAIMYLGVPARAGSVSTACFGIHCFLVGYLILRSAFLPRVVGALMVVAGLGWLTLSLARVLAPALGRPLAPYTMGAGILGEMSLALWLLTAGVNARRWSEQAGLAGR